MTIKMMTGGTFLLLFALAACDTGPYDPAAHHQADASTGSLLSGTDTGVNANGSVADPSISNNFGGGAAGGK